MDILQWIPTMIATGALAGFWYIIKRYLERYERSQVKFEATIKEEMIKVWKEIHEIRRDYMTEEKHILICGKSALEIEKMFKECLGNTKDAIFEKLREFERKLNKENDQV